MHAHHTGEGKFIHKERGRREGHKSTFWRGGNGIRRKFTIANLVTIVLINVVFLANLSNFLGSSFSVPRNVHHLKVLYVDYDNNSAVSKALNATYRLLHSNGFPTLVHGDAADFPTQQSLQHEVCKNRQYWGAISVHSGAEERLSAALSGTSGYNSSNQITYIWNSVRYTTWSLSEINGLLQQLISATNAVYGRSNPEIYSTVNTSSPSAISALAQPFTPSAFDLMPTLQGSRIFFNTVLTVMTIVSQFFFTMAFNGVASGFGLFTRLTVIHNMVIRISSGFVYSSCLGATITGVIWSFRDGWHVSGSQGVETWLLYTWICNIHFLVFDTAASFIPLAYLPLFVLTWVLTNVTSAVVPFELAPGFYHWMYAMPSHEAYQLLVTIWSRGCAPQLGIALPILFAWWILGFIGSWLSMIKKCNDATVVEKEEEQVEKDIDAEVAAEENLTKVETQADANSSAVMAASSDVLARKKTLQRDESQLGRVPDSLWVSQPVPFQESLGLTPVKSLTSYGGAMEQGRFM